MDDRIELGLRGAVKSVKETSFLASGEFNQYFSFDPAGPRTDLPRRAVGVVQIEDGGRAEKEAISGLDYWTMRGLHGTAFPTRGASTAETIFSSSSRAVRTIFKDHRDATSSRIEYASDERGQVVSAHQSLISGYRFLFPPTSVEGAEIESLRVTFSYDDAKRLVRTVDYLAGEINSTIDQTLNSHGDVELFEAGAGQTFHFSYDYDSAGNWIRRIARQSSGSTETHRVITYYERT